MTVSLFWVSSRAKQRQKCGEARNINTDERSHNLIGVEVPEHTPADDIPFAISFCARHVPPLHGPDSL